MGAMVSRVAAVVLVLAAFALPQPVAAACDLGRVARWPVKMDELKARYHALAKRHHPDANGGDRGAEERLKSINLAYAALRGKLGPETRMAATG